MSELVIGLLGCAVDNPNMGCVALTYSLIQVLNEISIDTNTKFKYIIFDRKCNVEAVERLKNDLKEKNLDIVMAPIRYVSFARFKSAIKTIVYLPRIITFYKQLKKCDVVIDLTEGDSFTNFYRDERFDIFTRMKEIVITKNIPLILGPQTYGPFIGEKIVERAKNVIEKAYSVYSRDCMSRDVLSDFVKKEVVVVTDLAFGLNYTKKYSVSKKVKIGINPSGLLADIKTENTGFDSEMKTDYTVFLNNLVTELLKTGNYEIHFIPHVGDEAYISFPNIDGVIYHRKFFSPIEAKNVISGMDIFIGSRMHATIAAFSSGVPTIPIAYSDKFRGLYDSIDYEYTLDLRELSTEEMEERTLKMIANQRDMLKAVEISLSKSVAPKYDYMRKRLKKDICSILCEKLNRK